jgi:cytochrome c-type biogenesis protein CcmF
LLKSPAGFEPLAREAFLLYNNIFLVVAAAMVLVGTLAPLIADALGQPALSIGSPYYDALFPILMLPLLALVSIGLHAAWKRGQLARSRVRILVGFAAAVVLGLVLVYVGYGPGKLLTPVGVVFGVWVIVSSLFDPIDRLRRKLSLPRAVIGMTIAHIGLGVGVLAVSLVESYTVERDVAIAPGETLSLGRFAYRFDDLQSIEGPNYDAVRARITVLKDGEQVAVLTPEQRNYWVQRQTLTETGIVSRWNMDLFVALRADVGAGRWSMRAQLRPFIDYVWYAAGLMALGGLLAATDRRYRTRQLAEEAAAAEQSGAKPA